MLDWANLGPIIQMRGIYDGKAREIDGKAEFVAETHEIVRLSLSAS